MIGSGLSDPGDDGSCRQLMDGMKTGEIVHLAVDTENLIKGQYEAS
jgi:hypothetical protein